ncbi:hypothetical protein H4W32_000740 [Actinophytocola algeriensis]|uniref:Uncharacterized protein n=1 Tax=Actinophytocola algeriensis TaxID=1768010 RepID=A0A7W7Q286_9PSEU|nr:hypothetical protein [Actinophytocola algeriensis]MBE1472698.1 hypothetical protein [Actinophytocola algeriensis]
MCCERRVRVIAGVVKGALRALRALSALKAPFHSTANAAKAPFTALRDVARAQAPHHTRDCLPSRRPAPPARRPVRRGQTTPIRTSDEDTPTRDQPGRAGSNGEPSRVRVGLGAGLSWRAGLGRAMGWTGPNRGVRDGRSRVGLYAQTGSNRSGRTGSNKPGWRAGDGSRRARAERPGRAGQKRSRGRRAAPDRERTERAWADWTGPDRVQGGAERAGWVGTWLPGGVGQCDSA